MEGSKLQELINNKNKSRLNKEQLIELIEYYQSCLDKINDLQNKTQTLYTQSNQHQENLKLFNDFYTEFFTIPTTENDDANTNISKIEHFKNLYHDLVIKASTIEQKSQDVETSYAELNKTIRMTIGDEEEDWTIAKYIRTYVNRISKIDKYEKQLEEANKSIENYKKQIESLKERFSATDEDIKKLLNPAAAVSVSNSYKETRENDYRKYSWSMLGNYILFLAPLILIILYFLYPQILGITIDESKSYLDKFLKNISVVIPFSIISWFGLNSIKKNKHMHDEYNHKQRLMQTYVGFKSEVINNDKKKDNSLFERLNDIVINTVAENPNKKFKEEQHYIEKIVHKVIGLKNKEKE